MANDNEVNIGTKIDESGLDKGLRNVKDKVNKTAKDINKGTKATNALKTAFNETGGAASSFASKMESVASSGGAVAAGITTAILAAKKCIETLKQANEAYKVQTKAENALAKAAENNPYLNGESVRKLQDYASELQNISNYGDEGTIDIMAQLASTGRTEAEIMKIMGAAADYAAAKHIDLKTAAETLNATYSGMAGTMGRQIADIKDLTDEQLKNGDAIDLIAQKYKGFAQESVDSSVQAKNAFGDMAESVGALVNPLAEKLDQAGKKIAETITGIITKTKDLLQYANENWVIGGGYRWAESFINEFNRMADELTVSGISFTDTIRPLEDDDLRILTNYLEKKKSLNKSENLFLIALKSEKTARTLINTAAEQYTKYSEKWRNASERELEARKAELEATDKSIEQVQEYKAVYEQLAALKEQERKAEEQARADADKIAKNSDIKLQEDLNNIRLKAELTGEAASAQEIYDVYLQSYLELLTKTDGKIKESYPVVQKRLEQLAEAKQAVQEQASAEQKLASAMALMKGAVDIVNTAWKTQYQSLGDTISQLKNYYAQIENLSDEEVKNLQKGNLVINEKQYLLASLDYAIAQLQEAEANKFYSAPELTGWDEYEFKIDEIKKFSDYIKSLNDNGRMTAGTVSALSKAAIQAQDNIKQYIYEQIPQTADKSIDEFSKTEKNYSEQVQKLEALKDDVQKLASKDIITNLEAMEKLGEIDAAILQADKDRWAAHIETVSGYINSLVDTFSNAMGLILQASKDEAAAEQAELETKYRKGEIGEEEYNKKIAESKKKAAKEQYKIQMWQWSASLLQATANIAQGVSMAIAQGGVAGLITGALVGAAGAVQIASIIASKPTPPSFSTGGIVGGSSYNGDNIAANLNSREMVMNMSQQKALWDFINGGSNGGAGGTNIVINNSAANLVRAQPQITKDKIELLIDARVNDSLKNGRYNTSLNMAQQGMSGDYYGI